MYNFFFDILSASILKFWGVLAPQCHYVFPSLSPLPLDTILQTPQGGDLQSNHPQNA